jgi:hypothetical protein
MKRWLAPITLAAAAALSASAGPAFAAATPTPVDPTPFPIACPTFNLQAQLSGKGGTIVLPGNRTFFTGPNLRITLTGPAPTFKTVTYVITGLTKVTTLPDGSFDVTATGRNTIIVPEANGHPAGLFLTTGTMHWTLNADGTERTRFSGNGTETDVCQLLAP